MKFTLHEGELHTLDLIEPENYRKLDFENQVINVSDATDQLVRTESDYRTDREMDIQQMTEHVERATVATQPLRERIDTYLHDKFTYLYGDTFVYNLKDTADYERALDLVKSDASVMVRHVERAKAQIDAQARIMDRYNLEIQKKYSIPAASFAFILIGAPLGIMTRRGGMGAAIAMAIGLFVIYWAFLIGGEDLADRGIVSAFWAMWSANILIGAVGIYLIYKVVTEKPLFSWFRRIN
jgi:lipopolysaccharide export system permease protein